MRMIPSTVIVMRINLDTLIVDVPTRGWRYCFHSYLSLLKACNTKIKSLFDHFNEIDYILTKPPLIQMAFKSSSSFIYTASLLLAVLFHLLSKKPRERKGGRIVWGSRSNFEYFHFSILMWRSSGICLHESPNYSPSSFGIILLSLVKGDGILPKKSGISNLFFLLDIFHSHNWVIEWIVWSVIYIYFLMSCFVLCI